ncbi:MAG: hypothetical protein LH649_03795 [Pseudanabaena sp. CAN_BIN31]|nr:hypothetical protein [Pseudanabaena sp. CAN_BIN31]
MSLQIRKLSIRVSTSSGLFGVDIPFAMGLCILHADNTSGKSTCLQSIVFALGLEGMLGPQRNIPLPPVVTDRLEYEGKSYKVIESEVLLEISNASKTITVRRQIKGNQDINLITVWEDAILSHPNTSCVPRDYFVRLSGAASRERGFHYFLARFVGWELPKVANYEDVETPLYMETLFPFLFVEQKRGWSNLRNRFPSHLKIKDLSRRAFEFLFAMDVQGIATQKILLNQQSTILKSRWSNQVVECNRLAASINATISNLPSQPIPIWPPTIQPMVLVSRNNDWISIGQEIFDSEEHLIFLEAQEIPIISEVSELVNEQLQLREEERINIEMQLRLKFEEIENCRVNFGAIQSRISSLKEELSKHKDLQTLSKLGSVREIQVNSGTCPTCHQHISDSLISSQEISNPMTIDQNVEFINEQLKIFKAMGQSEVQTLEHRTRQLNVIKSRAVEIREEIRSLKTTLTSSNNSPSYFAIEERIRLKDKIRHIKSVREQIDILLGSFEPLSDEWNEVQTKLHNLPKGILPEEDISKIRELEHIFQQQLQAYGFNSLSINNIKISEYSYFPEHDGFELSFGVSASDYIRVIWAYLLGLIEVSRNHETNHLGLLILDEPRQQSAREASIEAFLRRASNSLKYNQQVIVATSESREVLDAHLRSIPHTLHRFDGRIIAPIYF